MHSEIVISKEVETIDNQGTMSVVFGNLQDAESDGTVVQPGSSESPDSRAIDRALGELFDKNNEVVLFEVEKEYCNLESKGKKVEEMRKEFEKTERNVEDVLEEEVVQGKPEQLEGDITSLSLTEVKEQLKADGESLKSVNEDIETIGVISDLDTNVPSEP